MKSINTFCPVCGAKNALRGITYKEHKAAQKATGHAVLTLEGKRAKNVCAMCGHNTASYKENIIMENII